MHDYCVIYPSFKFRTHHYLGLILLLILLGWKLVRGISPDPITWHLHAGFILLIAGASALTILKNGGRLRKFDTSMAVFIFCMAAVVRTVAFENYRDAFTLASFAFLGFFVLTSLLTRVSERMFFDAIAFLFGGLVLFQFVNIADYFNGWGILDYSAMAEIEGVVPVEGVAGGRSFLLFFLDLEFLEQWYGRVRGVSGAPYASAGLMAAISVYAFVARRWLLAGFGMLVLILSTIGSAIVAFYVSMTILYRRKWWAYVPLLLFIPFLLWVFEHRGIEDIKTFSDLFLRAEMRMSGFEIMLASIIGEGKGVSSFWTELRVLGLLLSLGLIGIACIIAMLEGWRRGSRLPVNWEIRKEYEAASYFLLTLFLSTLHYNALFVYPNILFAVAFLALSASRIRVYHVAKTQTSRPGTLVVSTRRLEVVRP